MYVRMHIVYLLLFVIVKIERMYHILSMYASTVETLVADTPNSGYLLNSGQSAMYQLLFPYILYFKNPE